MNSRPSKTIGKIATNVLLIGLAVLAVLVAVLEASHSHGWQALLNSRNFMRMDSGHYTSIADQGYEFISCEGIPGMSLGDHCGNCGWFPGYPALIKALTGLSIPSSDAGFLISIVSTCLLAALLFIVLARINDSTLLKRTLVLLLALTFPGQIYLFSVFPLSLAIALILASMLAFQQGKSALASAFAAAAVFCYPGATWYVGALALASLFTQPKLLLDSDSVRKAATVIGIGAAGFLAVLYVHHVTVGQWDAFFLTQEKYDHHIHWPFQTIVRHFEYPHKMDAAQHNIQLMNFTRAFMVVATLGITWWKRKELQNIDRLAVAQGFFAWLMPLIAANPNTLASLRSGTLILPLVIVLRYLPPAALVPVILFLFFQATNTAHFFFAGHLP